MAENKYTHTTHSQVIPDTTDYGVAMVAAALELTRMLAEPIVYEEATPEERAVRLAKLFTLVHKEIR
jgi:hypothetical protein